MTKQFFGLLLLLSFLTNAQEGAFSPYSFYGTGLNTFKGTVENRSMGGISTMSDSIHINLKNPAAYADLDYTAFTGGITYSSITLQNNTSEDQNTLTTVDYFAIGIPISRLSIGFGLKPFTAVGYDINENRDGIRRTFEGRGGMNDVYLSAGYKLTDRLNIGATGSYKFGDIENRTVIFQQDVQFASREFNNTDLSSFNVNLGAQYSIKLNKRYELKASINYRPEFDIDAENSRDLAVVSFRNDGSEVPVNEVSSKLTDSTIEMPTRLGLGLSIGKERNWGIGLDYTFEEEPDFSSMPFNNRDNLSYESTNSLKLGGFYVPRYNDPQQYFNRVNYKFGLRYDELPITISGEQVEELGISFGMGLPAGRIFTNANLGIEYGMRGKVSNNLVEEEFLSLFLSFSFNDLWFQERKFN